MSSEIIAILSPALGQELAEDIVKHRKGLKCPLTARGARSLLKQYELTGDPVAAAEEHLNRGWQGFKAEWTMRPSKYSDQRSPTPRGQYVTPATNCQTREEYLAKEIERAERSWRH